MARPARKRPVSVAYCRERIKLIHVAKRDLGLDDETYRAILEEATGKTSSKDMEPKELDKVVEHLKGCGFVVKGGRDGKPAHKLADDPQSKKIRHLWLYLHELGEVRNPSELALAAFVRRQTGRERLEWLSTNQASNVIESLKQWVIRAGGVVE